MSFDIDMKSLTGADIDSAAANPQVVDTNSYSQEVNDAPIADIDLGTMPEEIAPQPESSPQAENFRSLREEVDRIKAEREAEKREYQAQLDMLRANSEKKNAPEPSPQRKFLDGLKDEDVPNVAELRKEWDMRESNYLARLEEMEVAQQHSDYAEVINKFASPLVKQKPILAEGFQGARNKALYAYELGKMAQQLQERQMPQAPVAPQISPKAQRIVENASKPGTLSQAGGQGALGKADYYATMSDADFLQMVQRNLEQI